MHMRRILNIYTALFGLLCLLGVMFGVFGRTPGIRATTLAEGSKVEALQANTPYRRLVIFQIPSGVTDAVGAIPDVPANKKLVIEFAAIRVFLPSTDPHFKAGIESLGGAFVPFVLTYQGSFGGFQHFVAAQPMNLVYESGGISKGVYASRAGNIGAANIQVYIVGHLE